MGTVILHIDDRAALPEGVAQTLRREGYELLHTADPGQAIDLVDRHRPGLVLMEPMLAGCDGLDLLEGIRARGEDPSGVPVLVLTRAPRSSGLVGEIIARGVLDILSKPVLASQLLSSIHELAPRPEQDAAAEAPPSHDLSGDLGDTPVPELLARLRRRGATGVLIASCGKARLVVQLRNGSPVAVSSTRLRASRRDEAGADCAQGAEAQLFEAFGWADGSYRFSEQRQLRADAALEITRETGSLLLAGVLEASPASLIGDRLRKRASLYVSVVEQGESSLDGLELTPAQQRLLADTGGDGTLGELLASNAFEERLLYGLWVAGRLELHAAATVLLMDALDAEGDESPAEPDPAAASAAGPEDVATRLRALVQQVMVPDDFDALDIPLFAQDGQIRAAYERLLQAIPEQAVHSPDPETRARAARIRERIELAYEHVKDPETRRAYALMRQDEEQDRDVRVSAERSLEAERWFRKGRGCLEGRRYDEATEAFGMASHLDPEEGEYLAHLGYAMFLTNPEHEVVQREATEHIANGIKRSPTRELSYVYLGRILRAKGDTETARKIFRRALRVNASCHPALQELRLLEMREARTRGILSRLWRR